MNKCKINICICGGGNMGHALAAMLGSKKDLNIYILSNKNQKWNNEIKGYLYDGNVISGKIKKISNRPEEVIPVADIILITVPAFLRIDIMYKISGYIKNDAWVGSVPGSGGFDWFKNLHKEKELNLFSLQRVPYICRICEYGKSVNISSVKDKIYFYGTPKEKLPKLMHNLKSMFNIDLVELNSFLEINISNSNPILHPSRLYNLFKNCNKNTCFNKEVLFYEEWDLESSITLLKCDEELQKIKESILIKLNIKSLKEHYEVKNEYELTNKIRNISAFKGIQVPLVKVNDKFFIDTNSRYFTEDIPYGLVSIKGIAELCNVQTPMIDKIILWSQNIIGKEYIINGKLIGKDIKNTGIPQNFNISSIEYIQ